MLCLYRGTIGLSVAKSVFLATLIVIVYNYVDQIVTQLDLNKEN